MTGGSGWNQRPYRARDGRNSNGMGSAYEPTPTAAALAALVTAEIAAADQCWQLERSWMETHAINGADSPAADTRQSRRPGETAG